MFRRTTGFFLTAVLAGLVTGTLIGELVARYAPEGPLKEFLLIQVKFGLRPATVDLIIAQLTFGFQVSFNLLSILLMILVILIFRKL